MLRLRAAVSGDAEQQQSLARRRDDDDDADDDCSTAASCPSRCACSDTIVDCRDRGLTDIPSSRSLPADTTELLSLSLSLSLSVRLSLRLSVPLRSCPRRAAALGYRHAGCLQLSHVWTADPSADGRRSAASRTAIGGGHIVSPPPQGDTLLLVIVQLLYITACSMDKRCTDVYVG